MIQMRWVKPGKYDEDTPKSLVIGYPECGNDYYVLQFREIIEVDGFGEPLICTNWTTVEIDHESEY